MEIDVPLWYYFYTRVGVSVSHAVSTPRLFFFAFAFNRHPLAHVLPLVDVCLSSKTLSNMQPNDSFKVAFAGWTVWMRKTGGELNIGDAIPAWMQEFVPEAPPPPAGKSTSDPKVHCKKNKYIHKKYNV